MLSFKYKEEFFDERLPYYKRVTVDKNIFTLLTVFIFESLIRTKGSKDNKTIFKSFDEKLNGWGNELGKKKFRDFLQHCYKMETLNSRFMEFKKSLPDLYGFFEEFMRFSLGFVVLNISNKVVVKKAAQTFRVYMKLRDFLAPDESLGSKVIGYFGVIERSLCLYYTQEMLIIDKSTSKRIKTHMSPFYYDSRNQNGHSYFNNIEYKIDRELKSTSSLANNSDESPTTIYEEANIEFESVSDIHLVCSSHSSEYYIRSNCGEVHCAICLHDSIINDGMCPCSIQISHKIKQEVSEIIKKKISSANSTNELINLFETKNLYCIKHPKCGIKVCGCGFNFCDQCSLENKERKLSKCKCGLLVDSMANTDLQVHSNFDSSPTGKIESKNGTQEIKIINENDLIELNPSAEIQVNLTINQQISYQRLYQAWSIKCDFCSKTKDDSEYQITCECSSNKTKCLECRSENIFKCAVCCLVYQKEITSALELYKLSKPNLS